MNDHDEYRVEEALARGTPSDADTPLLSAEQALAWFGEPRYSVTDLQRAYAEGHAAAILDATRTASELDMHCAGCGNALHHECEHTEIGCQRCVCSEFVPWALRSTPDAYVRNQTPESRNVNDNPTPDAPRPETL